MITETKCSDHPDAPHGFARNASHSVGHYVCECSGWTPPEPQSLQARLRNSIGEDDLQVCMGEAADKIDALEAEVTTLQDHITEITSEEHSIPELRQELIDQLEEKRKCYFAVSQYQKANQNLFEQVAALTKDAERLDHIQVTGSTVEIVNFGQKPVQHSFRVGGLYKAINFDLRLAIDAAMKESK